MSPVWPRVTISIYVEEFGWIFSKAWAYEVYSSVAMGNRSAFANASRSSTTAILNPA